MNPKYPVYVISKGRADINGTSKELRNMNVPHKVVIEPQEYEEYCKYVPKDDILVLPFSNLGQGSIPARNWVWKHSISIGADKHWILDDNISCFYRLNKNAKIRVDSGTIFKCAEDFTDRYENVALSGFNYDFFCKANSPLPPFYLNTRIYSCILIRNDLSYRWRGRYNEDTDLSLRALKDGYCTLLFNAFLAGKAATMTMKGGNTDELYAEDGREQMAKSLHEQHPDVASVVWKFGRWHHHVDYKPFRKNRLKLKDGLNIPDRVNNYGMKLIYLD